METIPRNHFKATRLVVDSFASASVGLAREAAGMEVPDLRELADTIWDETIRVYLRSPLRLYALSGYPDITPGYSHLMPILAGLDGDEPARGECRQLAARLSNEICRLIGRLLLVASGGGGEYLLTDGLRQARVCYNDAFELLPSQTETLEGIRSEATPTSIEGLGG